MEDRILSEIGLSVTYSANGGLWKTLSGVYAASIDTSSPTAPGGLTASGVTSSAFTLGWTASTDNVGVAGYRLDVSPNSVFSSFVAGYNNKEVGVALSTLVSGLTGGATYYARLRAYDAAGNVSANSASVHATTLSSADAIAPTVSLASLTSGSVISGNIAILAAASDNVGVSRIEFYVDNVLKNTDASTPYSFALDTTQLANGSHVILAKAYDGAGNTAQAAATVVVNNVVADVIAPVVSITEPAGGARLSGVIEIKASASDANGVSKVEFYIDDVLKKTDVSGPYVYKFNTLRLTNRAHTVAVRAYDMDNNMGSADIHVHVVNRRRTDAVMTSTGGVIISESAIVTIAPGALSGQVLVSVVDEGMDDDDLVAEREAKAKLQKLTPVSAGFRLLVSDYELPIPMKMGLPAKHLVMPAASMAECLVVYGWNEGVKAWQPLMSTPERDTINAESDSLSLYRLFSTVPIVRTVDVGEVYVFPNPAKKGAKPVFHVETEAADKVEIEILDFSGKVIHKKMLTGLPALINRNNKLTNAYEYEWDAKNAASGVYFYLVKINRGGGETSRKGKFAVIN
jgi:hypothetical protein